MNKKDNSTLSTIEWKIYNYLKERTLQDKWTSQNELVDYLENQGFHVDKRTIRRYISNIRKCEIIQKVILTSYTYGYRIMSEETEREILIERKISILKSLKQCNKDIKKYNLNNQMKITMSDYERDYIESLLHITNEEKELKKEVQTNE